jgi:hypothetical protein
MRHPVDLIPLPRALAELVLIVWLFFCATCAALVARIGPS